MIYLPGPSQLAGESVNWGGWAKAEIYLIAFQWGRPPKNFGSDTNKNN